MSDLSSYWIIETGSSRYLVSELAAERAVRAINNREALFTYVDIFGAPGTIVVRLIESVYESTPVARWLAHKHHAAWHAEEKAARREYHEEQGIVFDED